MSAGISSIETPAGPVEGSVKPAKKRSKSKDAQISHPAADLAGSRQSSVVFILSLTLVAATLAFYNPIVRNQFLDYDDLSYIQKNLHVLHGLTWEDTKWAFTTARDGNWHPLTWMSHALDCQIYGLNPIGHHYTSLLIHAANAVLLFLLLWRATGLTWPGLFVAALFALHPMNVESVAWAAERKNVLSMFFFLLTLHAYDQYAAFDRFAGKREGNPARYFYLLAVVLFACGLMSKPQIVTLPCLLLLWDYWPLERLRTPTARLQRLLQASIPPPAPRSFGYLVLEKIPFFLLAAADSAITLWSQRRGDSVRTFSEVSLPMRLENAVFSYLDYVGKTFWPAHLAPLYPRPESHLPAWQLLGATSILLVATALALRWLRYRYLFVGWLWFLGALVPMIGIVTVGEQAMADRYNYIPQVGLFVAAAWALRSLASRHKVSSAWLIGGAAVVVVVLGCLTYRQVGYWHDGETLWRYTLTVTDRNYVAHNNLGVALAKQGRVEEAVAEYRQGNALHQFQPLPLLGLGYYELLLGHTQQAIEACNTVLGEAHDANLESAAWSELGEAQMQLNRNDLAGNDYGKALRLNPDDNGALVGSGLLALRQGHSDVAVAQLFHAVKLQPSDVNAILFAEVLRRAGHTVEADSAMTQVRRIAEDLPQAQFEAGRLLALADSKPLLNAD